MLFILRLLYAVCPRPIHATYSGFAGTLDPDGDTNLFVTLRCMKIDGQDNTQSDQYTLYAGGGLLKDSTCQSEWEETEAKMNTMRQTFKL